LENYTQIKERKYQSALFRFKISVCGMIEDIVQKNIAANKDVYMDLRFNLRTLGQHVIRKTMNKVITYHKYPIVLLVL